MESEITRFYFTLPWGFLCSIGRGEKKFVLFEKHTTFIVFKVKLENKSIKWSHGTMGLVLLLISLFKAFNSKELGLFSLSLFSSFDFEFEAYKHNCKVTVFVINFLLIV